MTKSWEDRAAFCLVCGAPLAKREAYGAERLACTVCDFVWFRATATAAVAVVVHERSVLLVRRGIRPYRGQWGFPGGFQEHGESTVDTCIRETREETGLSIRVERVWSVEHTTDDPRKLVNAVVYLGRPDVEDGRDVAAMIRADDDADDVRWFSLDDLPAEIAFETNRRILMDLRRAYPSGDIT